MRSTHTFATLEVSAAAYDEIAAKFREAGYEHAFVDGAIDMHGVGLVRSAEPPADPEFDDSYPPPCTDPAGHEFECTGTQYGGDDERWNGEGRCLCIHCGADGDA